MSRVTLQIDGMSCSHCLNAVNQALSAVPGAVVSSVRMGGAEVEYPAQSGTGALVAAVEDAGYNVSLTQVDDG